MKNDPNRPAEAVRLFTDKSLEKLGNWCEDHIFDKRGDFLWDTDYTICAPRGTTWHRSDRSQFHFEQ